MQLFDIVINGGGILGLSLACGLQKSGLHVAVIERQIVKKNMYSIDQSSLYVCVINAASKILLQYLQIWQFINQGINSYHSMEVWEKDSFGKIHLNSSELGYPLGYVIENSVIYQALWQRIVQLTNITLFAPANIGEVVWEKEEAFITLDDDRVLTARLLIAADGSCAWLRQYANIPLTFWNYRHHMLVATVRTEQPHGNIARQAFHSDGVLMFLPLNNPHLSSIIWLLSPELTQQRLNQPEHVFNSALAMSFSLALGICELQNERRSFPLVGSCARNFAAHRLVLIGDAAYTMMHPLTGQEINIGFMDVAALLGELQRLQKVGKDIGHYPYLRRYERSRKHSAALMLIGMHGFHELFIGHNSTNKWFRSAILWLTDTLPGLKPYFIQQAIGLKDLPLWLVEQDY